MRGAGYKMLFYSGETDGAIATLGSKKWIQDLNWDVTKDWAIWIGDDQQVNGWSVEFGLLTFTIIRGVGHMAPQWARKPVLEMVQNFMTTQ